MMLSRRTSKHFATAAFLFMAVFFSVLLYLGLRLPQGSYTVIVVSLFSILVSFGLMLWPSASRANVAMVVLATGSTLLGIEFYFALAAFVGPRVAAGEEGREYDTRTKREVVEQYAKAGSPVVPSVFPSAFLTSGDRGKVSVIEIKGVKMLPLNNVSKSPILLCNEIGVWEIFLSDENGFNNPRGLWGSHDVDVVTIGDSYVEGNCVAPGNEMASVIRQRFPGTVNLGIGHTGPLAQLAILREYATELRPKTVLWFYHEGSDLKDLEEERQVPLLLDYLQPGFSQGLIDERGALDDAMLEHIGNAQRRIAFEDRRAPNVLYAMMSLRYIRAKIGSRSERAFGDQLPLFEAIMRTGRNMIEQWGGTLVFVYLPDWRRYYGMTRSSDPSTDLRERVLSLVRGLGIRVIDIHEEFAASSDPRAMFPRPGRHYSKLGYATAALAITRELLREGS